MATIKNRMNSDFFMGDDDGAIAIAEIDPIIIQMQRTQSVTRDI
jgi:hypothetical protein